MIKGRRRLRYGCVLLFTMVSLCRADWREQLKLSTQLMNAGRVDEAERVGAAELEAAQQTERDSARVGVVQLHLAVVKIGQGQLLEANSLCERSLLTLERTLGEDHEITLVALDRLVYLALQLGRNTRAESLARRAVDVSERTAPGNPIGASTA